VTPGAKFHWPDSDSPADAVLYAFGQAGTGAAGWAGLRQELAGEVELRAARLAGRESRFGEQPAATISAQVADLLADLADLIASDNRRYLLLGLCSGAVTAFESARGLQQLGVRQPDALVVVDQVAPAELAGLADPVHLFSPRTFRQWCLTTLTDRPELADDEVFEFFAPVLRADFSALSTYAYAPGGPLPSPVVVLAGDDADLTQYARWGEVTSRSATVQTAKVPADRASMARIVRRALLAGE